MPRKDILGWRIYEWCRPKSLADALQILGALVGTAWFVFTQEFGPWRPILPLLAVAFFCFVLWAISLVRQLLGSSASPLNGGRTATPPASTVQLPELAHTEGKVTREASEKNSSPPEVTGTPSVEFTFPSNWTPGFRIRDLGNHDGTKEHIQAEEIQLRVAAKKRMQNVRFELTAKRHVTDSWETVAQVGSEIFNGTVQKGQEQRFTIMHRLFRQRIGEATIAGERQSGRMRIDMETIFFPDNETGKFIGRKREQYAFHVTVFHDDGPETASFIVRLEKNSEFPQSQITGLNNVQPIMGH